MSANDAKSKRDLIWEQKKRLREQRMLGGGNQDAADPGPAINFAKQSPFEAAEPVQQTRPLENQDVNRGRDLRFSGEKEQFKQMSQPNLNEPFQNRASANDFPPRGQQMRPEINQPNYSEYEPVVNRNQAPMRMNEAPQERKATNFNPSFQPSGDHFEPAVRDSREMQANENLENKRRKADYGEELRNQMKQKEMQKQQDRINVRNSSEGAIFADNARDDKRKQQEDYRDYLQQQMKGKQNQRGQDSDRKARLIQNMEGQDYNPFGRAGAGAPVRAYGYNQQPVNNYPDQRQYPPQQPQYVGPQSAASLPSQPAYQQQQAYEPVQYQPQRVQQQPAYEPIAQNDRYQPQRAQQQSAYEPVGQNERYQPQKVQQQQQQPYYMTPGNSQSNLDRNNAPRQDSFNLRHERNASLDQIPRTNTIEDAGGNVNFARGNTFENRDPQEVAKKERQKQEYQRGLQEQIEEKKRAKEMELQRKKEEERIEEDRIRKEQMELARREENEKQNKKKVQATVDEANHQYVQQPRDRANRNRQSNPDELVNSGPNPNQMPQRDPGNMYQAPPPQYQQQQPPPYQPYQPAPYQPYGQPYASPPSQPYNQPYPPPPQQQPPYYYPQQQQGGMYPPPPYRSEVTNELHNIRSEIQNQQAVLSQQLDMIKREAMSAMDERNRAEQELGRLREQLKQKIVSEDLYKKNLRDALEKNSQSKIQKMAERPTKPFFNDAPPQGGLLDPFAGQEKKRSLRPPRDPYENNNYAEFHEVPKIDKPAYEIRRTGQNLLENPHETMNLDGSQYPHIDINRTLAGDTKLIPLAVFDNKGGSGNQNQGNYQGSYDPLTLSKIQNYGMLPPNSGNRPNSSKPWAKNDDSIDALLKIHGGGGGALRPSTGESEFNTTNILGRRLEETSAIMKNDDMYNYGAGGNRNRLKSRENETLTMAGRNLLGDKSINAGANNQYGYDDRQGIKINNNLEPLPDLSMGYGHHDDPMDVTGMSFNIDRINMANEARLNKLDNMGGLAGTGGGMRGGDNSYMSGKGGRANYYNNRGAGLEAIQEDTDAGGNDDNLARIDKILGGYLKTHEAQANRKNMMM